MTNKKENYIVLARKYRPKKLSDILGQDEACSVIEGSIKLNRVAHAFLFSGTRGIGKTTIARILAKMLNCNQLSQNKLDPCEGCSNCNSINNESNIDVVEIDAASRTGVSDIREIIENINYKPVSARKKIFIIDEVHMLSKAAFNALLKTLEEPPQDVVFIFATTETEKIPVTILSRCQRFNLKRVDIETISNHLIKISKKEGYEISEDASRLIAQCSEGSVRDALSILDNVLTKTDSIGIDGVRDVLGLADNSLALNLFESLFKGDAKSSLEQFNDLYCKGISIDQLAKLLMNFSYNLAMIKSDVDVQDSSFDQSIMNKLKIISENSEMDFITRFWELLQKYIKELSVVFDEKQCFDMTIMRLCYASIVPTPFEVLKENTKEINDNFSKAISKSSTNSKKLEIKNEDENLVRDNLARKKEKIEEEKSIGKETLPKSQFEKFSSLVNLIEDQSEMVISFHLKNSFRLISFKEPEIYEGVGNIEFQCISNNIDSKKILWKASKIIESITGRRWILSISNNKGMKSIAEYQNEKNQTLIENLKKEKIIKKILEIIPLSEVVSIEEVQFDELPKKKD
ncbi:MAG: hypothetical protein CMM95_00540 [Rickettsiales bacterium]|nr:hypothetical protein [Rickettsiales bacterium]